MTNREGIFLSIIILLVLVIVAGLIPVIIGSITNKGRSKQPAAIAANPEAAKIPQPVNNAVKKEVLLMVSGKISLVDTEKGSFVILTSDYRTNYILTGQKTEELKGFAGKEDTITVIGLPLPPTLAELNGQKIKRDIEVRKIQIKKKEEPKQ